MDNYENNENLQPAAEAPQQPEMQQPEQQAEVQQPVQSEPVDAQPEAPQPQAPVYTHNPQPQNPVFNQAPQQPPVYGQYRPPVYNAPYTAPNPWQNPQNVQNPYEPNSWQPQYTGTPVPPKVKTKKKKSGKGWKVVVAAVLAVVLVVGSSAVTAGLVSSYWQNQNTANNLSIQQMKEQIKDLEELVNDNSYTGNGNSVSGTPNTSVDGSLTPAQVYAQCRKSVVAISNQVSTNIFGQVSQTASTGSGFIVSEDGYIVTNYHVIEGDGAKLSVIIYDGTEYSATLVGGDSHNDLAVLKIDAENLPFATMGSSDALIVGDMVAAIGNPLGELTNSLTVGYISAKDRSIASDGSLINMLQTDAAINSGNSGGPLFNMKGEVIGITSAKYSGTSSSGASIEGIGFAIPMDDVIKKINDLMEHGYITGAYLGVSVRDMDSSLTNYGIPMGAYVEEVTKGVSADRAGVKAKDIIIALGGEEVTSVNTLTRALGNLNAGETTTIVVWRSGQQLTLEITLDEKPRA